MSSRPLGREAMAILPWLGAVILWLGAIAPMRADQATRLTEQSRLRRERLKVERIEREVRSLQVRVDAALGAACQASSDPTLIRERAVASAVGLSLSPLALSVTGSPTAGAVVEAEGSRSAVMQVLARLGDPVRGGFLRAASMRDKGSRWAVTAMTGVIEALPAGLETASSRCAPGMQAVELTTPTGPAVTSKPLSRPRTQTRPLVAPPEASIAPPLKEPEPAPAPPFSFVAFLTAEGKSRVSLRVDGQIRVVSVGDTVGGWRCVSVDRDEGAVFVSGSGARLVLKPGA